MKQYLDLLRDILDNGTPKADRTGVGTLSVFGRQLRFDLSKGFPLLTTKRLHFKSIACEHMVAAVTGLVPGELIISLGDAHLYQNHLSQAREQLAREPRPLPVLDIQRQPASIDDFRYEDMLLGNYNPHPHIPAEVAV